MLLLLLLACCMHPPQPFPLVTHPQRYDVIIDWPTFAFLMLNFGLVGTFSIFYQNGIPRTVTQGYLIMVAVIMAWILTKLPVWTAWALLVMLALYDLCAVLTPCGPLNCLIQAAQQHRDPIPGLLYEANVGEGTGTEREQRRRANGAVRDTLVTRRGVGGPGPDGTEGGSGGAFTTGGDGKVEGYEGDYLAPGEEDGSMVLPAAADPESEGGSAVVGGRVQQGGSSSGGPGAVAPQLQMQRGPPSEHSDGE